MASKVLSAKRKTITVTYEFNDGTTTSITVQSLSTNEGKSISAFASTGTVIAADVYEKNVRMQLQKNDADVINKIVQELYEEGDIKDFSESLSMLIVEEKKGKLKDLLTSQESSV